ncbi:hypothetical protein CBS101457_005211 [Exobasidium rhododendri]|nr:hypothetical protein CBS101457_005211 [Exobasidium rhododendri]
MSSKPQPTWPAELYAQARPDYPPQIIEALFDASTSSEPLNIVDMGAGTGICTKLLIQACQKSANGKHQLGSITSLDAAPNMLKELARTLFEQDGLVPGLQKKGELNEHVKTNTGVATFETFDASVFDLQGKVDLITIAQAWHWCSDWEKGLRNMADALKKGGHLALIWNLEDRNGACWVAQVRDLYEVHENDTPQYRHNYWHAMYKTEAIKDFEIVAPQKATRLIPTTVEGVCDRIKSKSYISVLSPEKQEDILKNVRHLFQSRTDEELQRKWIDREKGIFEYPYTTGE